MLHRLYQIVNHWHDARSSDRLLKLT